MKSVLFVLVAALAPQSFAQGARKYTSIDEAKRAGFYRLTCSSTDKPIQAHFYVEVQKGAIVDLKIVTVAPAESINVIQFKKPDYKTIALKPSRQLVIEGTRPGVYWSEEISIRVGDAAAGGFEGTVTYDDGDGLLIERAVKCGIVNYILNPRD